MLTYLFSSMAIKAVGRTAQMVVQDVRDQFKENPGIMLGTSKPDYGRCVRIVTGAALKEMILPGALVVALPVAVGLIFRHFSASFQANAAVYAAGTILPVPAIAGKAVNLAGAEAVAGLLMVGTISGVLLAMLMNNGGGAWDNAKKYIETGQYGGKKSEAHKAAVVGDTVGDPFKDTSSVALNPVIKFTTLFGLLAVELAVSIADTHGQFGENGPLISHILAAVFFLASLVFVWRSFHKMRIGTLASAGGKDE
jgi:K(+)-stimulated pyrophosphate-energized sodium pump